MKATVILLGLVVLLGCSTVKQTHTVLTGPSSLVFIGNPETYSDSVTVKIDEGVPFPVVVIPEIKESPDGKVYEVATGKHFVTVLNRGAIIFKKQLSIREHEMKRVVLP